MASFDLPEIPQTRVSPALLVGAASPLWSYFAAATAGGVAYWWMTQWARPVNLEALLGAAKVPPSPFAAIAAPAIETAETASEAVEAVVEDLPPLPVGGEAAPVSPLLESTPEPVAEPEILPESFAPPAPSPAFEPAPEAALEAAAEPVTDPAPEPLLEEPTPLTTDPAPKSRGKKGSSFEA
ncbi:MAG TPA: hypothetical protein VJU34_07145 [Phenylobacterium sp.]|nr:hypothetical protein [Phenylobacterium sp.]